MNQTNFFCFRVKNSCKYDKSWAHVIFLLIKSESKTKMPVFYMYFQGIEPKYKVIELNRGSLQESKKAG